MPFLAMCWITLTLSLNTHLEIIRDLTFSQHTFIVDHIQVFDPNFFHRHWCAGVGINSCANEPKRPAAYVVMQDYIVDLDMRLSRDRK